MVFLLDANVLIFAEKQCCSIDKVERYRQWIVCNADQRRIFLPLQIILEISKGSDDLKRWINQRHIRNRLEFRKEVSQDCVGKVLLEGYGENLSEREINRIGADAHLITYAIEEDEAVIVTRETSKPARQRANRKILDVCAEFGVSCIDDSELYRRLDFDPFSV